MDVARPGIADLVEEGTRGILEAAEDDVGGDCCAAVQDAKTRQARSRSAVNLPLTCRPSVVANVAIMAVTSLCAPAKARGGIPRQAWQHWKADLVRNAATRRLHGRTQTTAFRSRLW